MATPRTYSATESSNPSDLIIALNTTLYGKIVRKWILADLKCRKSKRFGNLEVDFADYGVIIKFMIGLINDNVTGYSAYELLVTKVSENLKELGDMKLRARRFKKMGNREQHGVTVREYNNIKHTLNNLMTSTIVLLEQVLGEVGIKHVVAGTMDFEEGLVIFNDPEETEKKEKLTEIDYGKRNDEVREILDRIESRARNRKKH